MRDLLYWVAISGLALIGVVAVVVGNLVGAIWFGLAYIVLLAWAGDSRGAVQE